MMKRGKTTGKIINVAESALPGSLGNRAAGIQKQTACKFHSQYRQITQGGNSQSAAEKKVQMALADSGFPRHIPHLNRLIQRRFHIIAGSFDRRMHIPVFPLDGFNPVETQKNGPDQRCRLKRFINSVQLRKVFKPPPDQTVPAGTDPAKVPRLFRLQLKHGINGPAAFQITPFVLLMRRDQKDISGGTIEILIRKKPDPAAPRNDVKQLPSPMGMRRRSAYLTIASCIRKYKVFHKK